ncbi:MAG: Gfo/Idh/MocA family oxidoreductase [Acidobacteriaceae bacterium]|nr:Gfo/Idh/MocA family oxidoreductase [Acidobacteriaceae bacterium]
MASSIARFTRRDFGRAVGTGLSLSLGSRALSSPRQSADEGRRIGYAIVGLGRISLGHFMPACKMSKYSKVIALVSGHRDKAEKTAAEYGVSTGNIFNYQNYEEIAGHKDIDAVYIALPNSMHAEYTIRAAKAGKHVLCEKPMCTSVREAESMIEACKTADKKLMIAYRCQYEPTNLHAVQLIGDGKLGKIQVIESANGFNIHPHEWRLDKKLAGGGPLMDVGIYSLNACRYLTGEEPVHVEGYSSVVDHDGRFEQVEENLSWTMTFPSGAVAACTTTYGANTGGWCRVHGSKGSLTLDPAFAYQGIHLTTDIRGEPPVDDPEQAKDPAQFATEADEFAQDILQNRSVKASGEEGLRDMKWMDAIYKSAGITTA